MVYNARSTNRFVREPMPEGADRILERHAVTRSICAVRGEHQAAKKSATRLIEDVCGGQGRTARDHPQFSSLKLLLIISDSAEGTFGSAARRHSLARAGRCALSGVRAASRAARFLFAGQRVSLPFLVRRIRTSTAGGHGARRAGAHFQQYLRCRKFSRRLRCSPIRKMFLKFRAGYGKSLRKTSCATPSSAAATTSCRNIPGSVRPSRCGKCTAR